MKFPHKLDFKSLFFKHITWLVYTYDYSCHIIEKLLTLILVHSPQSAQGKEMNWLGGSNDYCSFENIQLDIFM